MSGDLDLISFGLGIVLGWFVNEAVRGVIFGWRAAKRMDDEDRRPQ